MSSREHAIQNEIRNALAGKALIFRANVGQAWTGSKVNKLPGNRVLIEDARPFNTGLPAGFSDLFGLTKVVITPDMVGQSVAVFVALEVKDKAKATEGQSNFLKAVNDNGGRAGVVRSIADALGLIERSPGVLVKPRYVLHPGNVTSKNDGQRHFIGADKLRSLYGLKKSDRFFIDYGDEVSARMFKDEPGDVHLHPRYDGDYTLPGGAV